MTIWLKRIAFEKDHIHKPLEFRRTVIFSDEDKFCIFGIKGRKLVWRKPCTALQKEHLRSTVKIRQHNVSRKDMLKTVLKDQWEKISAEKTTRFVSSMPKRLQEVLK
ncbi:hypothetical protein TNCV_3489801 [Trichonephila clavipes]|nr:hypothetical protein TNCV_3489801 [Trichonephila clavipes]